MFNFRPPGSWPWFNVQPPADDPPGFRVAADGSVRNEVAFAGPGSAVGLSPPSHIGVAVEDRLPKDNPFNFLDRHRLASPLGDMPPSPQISPIYSWIIEPPPLEPELQGYPDNVDTRRDTPAQSGGEPTASFLGGLAEPSVRAAPMVSGIFPGALGEQNPSAASVGNPSKSPLLPVGDDGHRYIQNRLPNSVGGARGISVDEEGREVLTPEKPDKRELDSFEKLKQRGHPKPPEDPGDGSAIVTELRKHYRPNHPNYHRYEFRDALCDLNTPGCSVEAAYDALLRYAVPGGPAPGVPIENEKVSPTSFKRISGGHVQTFVEPESRSIINRTMPNHNFHDGFAQRQIVVEDGKISNVRRRDQYNRQ